jgi:hypothetical protein
VYGKPWPDVHANDHMTNIRFIDEAEEGEEINHIMDAVSDMYIMRIISRYSQLTYRFLSKTSLA